MRNYMEHCPCGSKQYAEIEFDARGIELGFMCDVCRKERLGTYRPEVLSDCNYDCNEPIDAEEW